MSQDTSFAHPRQSAECIGAKNRDESGEAARRADTLARVAVQLAREDAGQYLTAKEIARSAAELVAAAFDARQAIEQRRSPKSAYGVARRIAANYGAEVIARGDLNGMVLGLRLHSGRFVSGFENLFFVA